MSLWCSSLQLSNAEFNVLVRWRLGCEIGGGAPLCGVASNSFGDHLVCCAQNGVVRRHNAIAYYLSKLASASSLPHRVECGLGGEMRERPGDISLLQWRGGGVHYVDICVCHPLTLSSVWSLVESGSECLEEAEAGKRRKYKSVLPDVDNCFSVFGVSTF